MKCPLSSVFLRSRAGEDYWQFGDCLQAECGQWDENTELCARVAEVRVLTAIGNVLGRIADSYDLNRYTFRCHDCTLTIETGPGSLLTWPRGWIRKELIDGKHVLICPECARQ